MRNNNTKRVMFRYYLTPDDEEDFINNMCSKGWKINDIKCGFIYKFKQCKPDEYICRIVFLLKEDGKSIDREKNVMMREILEDQDAEILNTTSKKHVIYVLRKSNKGKFEINSDIDSKINDYTIRKRSYEKKLGIAIMFGCIFIANNFWIGILNFSIALLYQYSIFKLNKVIKQLNRQRIIQE